MGLSIKRSFHLLVSMSINSTRKVKILIYLFALEMMLKKKIWQSLTAKFFKKLPKMIIKLT